MTTALARNKRQLGELESVIERGMKTFVEVGAALLEIRTERLYRAAGFDDFDTYCRERWGWTRQRGHQLIEAATVSRILDTPPKNAGTAAELAKIADQPELVRRVWDEVQQKHGDKVTAAVVRDAVVREVDRFQQRRAGAAGAAQLMREFTPEGFDAKADQDRIVLRARFLAALKRLATMPAAADFVSMIPHYQSADVHDSLSDATAWLRQFEKAWKEKDADGKRTA